MKIVGDEIRGLKKVAVVDKESCLRLFMQGNTIRHVGLAQQTASTSMNTFSSRSHSIFSFYLADPRNPNRLPARLCFVDLAGSERNARSKSVGKTFTEAKNINLSLLTLEKVVLSFEKLSEGERAHFPFRESNLTLLLKDLFISDSILTIVCNISPEKKDLDETINTLKFCGRCKNLKIKVSASPTVSQKGLALRQNAQVYAAFEEWPLLTQAERPPGEVRRARAIRRAARARSEAALSRTLELQGGGQLFAGSESQRPPGDRGTHVAAGGPG